MAQRILVDEPAPSRIGWMLLLFGLATTVGVAVGGQALAATAYAAALLPLVSPLLYRALSPVTAARRSTAKLKEGTLRFRSGSRVRRLNRSRVEGGALLSQGAYPSFLLSPSDGPTLVVSPSGAGAQGRLVTAFGLEAGRVGVLRFVTARAFPVWEYVLRAVPLAGVFALDAKLGLGWSVYLLVLPPFPLGLCALVGGALSGTDGPLLKVTADTVSLGGEEITTCASILSVTSDEASVTLTFTSRGEPRQRRFVLARGHEWQAKALRACLAEAAAAAAPASTPVDPA